MFIKCFIDINYYDDMYTNIFTHLYKCKTEILNTKTLNVFSIKKSNQT